MKLGGEAFGAADRRLLPEGRLSSPMPWVIAVMMFLTILAAAAGLALGSAASSLEAGDRLTIQIVEANPERREVETQLAMRVVEGLPGIVSVQRVGREEMRALLQPWLGGGALDGDIPIPDMIDIAFSNSAGFDPEALRRRLRIEVPSAQVGDHGQSLAPLAKLIASLRWLAGLLVILMAAATAAVVVLAARAALDTHRATIEVLHLMGATDTQVARLFQRRIALDALFGGLLGFLAALLVLWLIGGRMRALGSDLVRSVELAPFSWPLLVLLPLAGTLLAMTVARWTILRAMRHLS